MNVGVYHSSNISKSSIDFEFYYYDYGFYSVKGYGYIYDVSRNRYFATAEIAGWNINGTYQSSDIWVYDVSLNISGIGSVDIWSLNLNSSNYSAVDFEDLASKIAHDMLKQDDSIFGSDYNDFIYGEGGDDEIRGLDGSDYIDGGSGYDTSVYFGSRSNYTLGLDDYSRVVVTYYNGDVDILASVEAIRFYSDVTLVVDEIFPSARYLDVRAQVIGSTYALPGLRDFDSNFHGIDSVNTNTSITSNYKFHGLIDANGDGSSEAVYTNTLSGRWATATVDPLTGLIDYSQNGSDGTTRIVGIYVDPLVASALVAQGGEFDSQRRFQNDLSIDNLSAKISRDFDGDGYQEVYWKTNDGTAYLRALMHADGNIQYANYQNRQQMTDYLTANGNTNAIASIII